MNDLMKFLSSNPVEAVQKEVVISERLKDFKFKVKAMTDDDFNRYQSKATRGKKKEIDPKMFKSQVIIENTLNPDFKSAEFAKSLSVMTPEQALSKSLLAGEVQQLASEILKLSGFDPEGMEELKEEAKN